MFGWLQRWGPDAWCIVSMDVIFLVFIAIPIFTVNKITGGVLIASCLIALIVFTGMTIRFYRHDTQSHQR